MAHVLGAQFKRIQFTPDLSPEEIIGLDEMRGGELVFKRGVVFTNVLLADEINRTPPRTQAALLEAMQERTVTVEGRTHQLPDPFLVIATQNPFEHEGIFPLPESQLDRFLFKIILDYADTESEVKMLQLPHTGVTPDMLGDIHSLLGVVGLDRARANLDHTEVPEEVARYVISVVRHTRQNPGARARSQLAGGDPPAQRGQGPGPARRTRPRHARRRARDGALRAHPPPHHPGQRRVAGASRPGRRWTPEQGMVPGRGRHHPSTHRLHECPLREHSREVLAELRGGRGVARRLRALGGMRGSVRRRRSARNRILDRLRPQRRAAHARERDGRSDGRAVVAMDERRDADRGPVLGATVVLAVRPSGRAAELRDPDLREYLPRPDGALEDAGEERRPPTPSARRLRRR